MNFTEFSRTTAMLLSELEKRSDALVVIESCLFAFLLLASLVGNALVVHAVRRNSRLRTPPNYYVLSLCVSDILMALGVMPWSMGVIITGKWPYGFVSCQVQGFLSSVLAYVSIITISLIAVNRYLKVLQADLYRRHVSARSTTALVISAWVLACVGPLAYVLDDNEFVFHPGKLYCTYNMAQTNTIRMVLVYIVYMLVPCTVIVWCYWKVLRVVRRHNTKMAGRMNRNQFTPSSIPTVEQQLNLSQVEPTQSHSEGEFQMTGQATRNTSPSTRLTVREINITKSLLAVVLGFSICYLQITIVDTIEKFRGNFSLPRQAYVFYMFMAGLASCINPVVYGVINTAFREEFRKMFVCC